MVGEIPVEDVYVHLARHLEHMIMGYPYDDALLDLLKEMFSPVEAQVALAIPNDLVPLEVVERETIVSCSGLSEEIVRFSKQGTVYPRLFSGQAGRTNAHGAWPLWFATILPFP
jgi:hypothetical protein